MTAQILTQERLKELFYYSPQFGIFVWKKDSGQRAKSGSIAGTTLANRYISIKIYGKCNLAHRLAFLYMTGEFPKNQGDHINGVRSDNRWNNLRDVTPTENSKNKRPQLNNKTGIPGIFWYKRERKWEVQIGVDGRPLSLGYFVDFFEACCIRKSAERKYNYHPNHGRR